MTPSLTPFGQPFFVRSKYRSLDPWKCFRWHFPKYIPHDATSGQCYLMHGWDVRSRCRSRYQMSSLPPKV
ncbi:MAG: hypothetical protein Q9224_001282 [Gallowayella concinna]